MQNSLVTVQVLTGFFSIVILMYAWLSFVVVIVVVVVFCLSPQSGKRW